MLSKQNNQPKYRKFKGITLVFKKKMAWLEMKIQRCEPFHPPVNNFAATLALS